MSKAIRAETREQIRQDYDDGLTYAQLKAKYGVSKGSLSNIINNPDPPAAKPTHQNPFITLRPRQTFQDATPRTSEPEYWPHPVIDISPGRSQARRNPPRELPPRDPETGKFLPRGSQPSTTLAIRESGHEYSSQSTAMVRRSQMASSELSLGKIIAEGIAWLYHSIKKALFGESQQTPANSHRLLTAGNQIARPGQYIAPPYQTGIFAQPDPLADYINGLNGADTKSGFDSSAYRVQWNDPIMTGMNAQQTYGGSSPSLSDYYTCANCGSQHAKGYGCPWELYR